MTNKLSIITGHCDCYQIVEKHGRIIFNSLYEYVEESELLLSTCGVFLDMSTVFDKVWQQGLIFNLESIGVPDSQLCLIESFSSNRFQRVLLNGQTWEWLSVKVGLPQDSILGPLFFIFPYWFFWWFSINNKTKTFCSWHFSIFCFTW